jgi:hypothetical protein
MEYGDLQTLDVCMRIDMYGRLNERHLCCGLGKRIRCDAMRGRVDRRSDMNYMGFDRHVIYSSPTL